MTRYRTHQWSNVVEQFRALAVGNSRFVPLADAVARLAESRYAAGLYPVKSMQTLILYQHERSGTADEQLHLDGVDGELVVRYMPGSTPDPRLALTPVHGTWTKRGTDGMGMLERAFHHLRWFVEYRAVSDAKATERTPAR